MAQQKKTSRTPEAALALASALASDLALLEARFRAFSGADAEYSALLEAWVMESKAAALEPAFIHALIELEPRVLARVPGRALDAMAYVGQPVSEWIDWLAASRETTNYTYDLTAESLEQLAWFAALVSGTGFATAKTYVDECLGDTELNDHIVAATMTTSRRLISDPFARFGRRIGWYAITRARRPKVVVETGVDKGLGTCVLAAALRRNRAEGHPGHLYGLDIVPGAGELLSGPYCEGTSLIIGNSLVTLRELSEPIDLFIHDSDHRAEHERREFQTVKDKLAPRSVVLSDNAHVTSELSEFAKETARHFAFYRERPEHHFYPGAGIGAAF